MNTTQPIAAGPPVETEAQVAELNDDLAVITDADVASAAIEPRRAQILAALAQPGSASTVAAALGLSRQKVNYHLRILEDHRLVRMVAERPRRGLTERIMIATARSYVISPDVLGRSASDPSRIDRLSTRYLLAVAARIVREVAELARRSDDAGKSLPTLTVDTDLRFASPQQRADFAAELGEAVSALSARYHDETAADGRWYRLVATSYPRPQSATATTTATAKENSNRTMEGSSHG